MARSRVLIADDHTHVLKRISEVLEAEYDVVAAVTNGLDAVDAASMFRPDVVILDVSMPVLNGLEVAITLCHGPNGPRVVFLSVHDDPDYVEAAKNVGGHAYVVKRTMLADLLPALKQVLSGHTVFPVPAEATR
jgi:DNA-binding NarL/FixJ family response regulator